MTTTEKDKLLLTLFERPGRELVNIKFCRGTSDNLTEDAFCAEVNKVLFAMDAGFTNASDTFAESANSVDVKELAKRLA